MAAGLKESRDRADEAVGGLKSARSGLQRAMDQAARLAAEVKTGFSFASPFSGNGFCVPCALIVPVKLLLDTLVS